jgi:hypothetical protein
MHLHLIVKQLVCLSLYLPVSVLAVAAQRSNSSNDTLYTNSQKLVLLNNPIHSVKQIINSGN